MDYVPRRGPIPPHVPMRADVVTDAAVGRAVTSASTVTETFTVALHHGEALLEFERRVYAGRPPQTILHLRLRAPGTLSHCSLSVEPAELRTFASELRALATGTRTECGLRQPGANGSSVELRSLAGHARFALSMRCAQATPGLALSLRNWPVSAVELQRLLVWADS